MAGLVTLLENIKNLSVKNVFLNVLKDKEVQAFIVTLNTTIQLFDEGIDAEGKRLDQIRQPYSDSYRQVRLREGLPVDRVTLFRTGQFYESWTVKILNDLTIEIEADSEVRAGYDLQSDYGFNIVGLTDESFQEFKKFIQPRIIKSIDTEIRRGL